eukprot:1034482-Pleurochrysis_carterae.AAC.1
MHREQEERLQIVARISSKLKEDSGASSKRGWCKTDLPTKSRGRAGEGVGVVRMRGGRLRRIDVNAPLATVEA